MADDEARVSAGGLEAAARALCEDIGGLAGPDAMPLRSPAGREWHWVELERRRATRRTALLVETVRQGVAEAMVNHTYRLALAARARERATSPDAAPSPAAARSERNRELILEEAQSECSFVGIVGRVWDATLAPRPTEAEIESEVQHLLASGHLRRRPESNTYRVTPHQAATETRPEHAPHWDGPGEGWHHLGSDELKWLALRGDFTGGQRERITNWAYARRAGEPEWLPPRPDNEDTAEALLLRLWREIDQEGRDDLTLHAEALAGGGAWMPVPLAPEQGWLELRRVLDGAQRDEVAAYALALIQKKPWQPWIPVEELFAKTPEPPTTREGVRASEVIAAGAPLIPRLGDTPEEERAADEWVDGTYKNPLAFAIKFARDAEGVPARRRAQIRMLRATASELAARDDGDAARGVIAFIAWLCTIAGYPPDPSSAPIPCVQCGANVEGGRRCYVSPTCYACLPPPEPLPVNHLGGGAS